MTIAQSTTIQAYQLRKGGTRARLAILRMVAADSVNNRNPHTRLAGAQDWRKARHYTMGSYSAAYCAGLSPGFNGAGRARVPVWYGHMGEQFRNERYADEVLKLRHTGWYADADENETARGIVGSLSHGRFIAGYELSENGERVYFGTVHTDETEAARMADEHARVIAEDLRECSEKYKAAQELETEIETKFDRLRECLALRHRACMDYVRDEARELIAALQARIDAMPDDKAIAEIQRDAYWHGYEDGRDAP